MVELDLESETFEVWSLLEMGGEEEAMAKADVEESVIVSSAAPLVALPRNPRTEETMDDEEGPTATHSYSSYTTPPTTNSPP